MRFHTRPSTVLGLAVLLAGSGPARAGDACGADPLCPANTLFASTDADAAGDADLLVVDRATGATTYDFTYNVGAGNVVFTFAYHDTLDRYFGLTYDVAAAQVVALAVLDRATRDVTLVPISGVPGGAPDLGNLTYDPLADVLLASFADDGSSMEDQLVELFPDGSAGMASTVVAEDLDGLTVRRTTGQLFGWDSNAVGGPRLFELTDLFGTLTAGTPLPLPDRADLGALVADPSSDAFYVVDRAADGLLRIDGEDTYVDLGPFGHTEPIRSLFFGPALACGDGIVDPGEQCDDGNLAPGDGCDGQCMEEPEACPDASALAGELKAQVKLSFAKPAKDKVALKGKGLALPPGFALPADVHLDVGGIVVDASLDEKGRYKGPDGRDRWKLKPNERDGTWKLAARRTKSDLAAELSEEGLADEDNPKPGKPVALGLCLTVDGQNHAADLPLVYRSKLGRSGKAK